MDVFLHVASSSVMRLPFELLLVSPSSFTSLLSQSPAYKVSISGTKVTLTCLENSESEAIKWAKDNVELPGPFNENKQLELEDFSEVENSGYYACYTSSSKEKNHYLYLKARGNTGLQSKGC